MNREGYFKSKYELIERALSVNNQSRNLFTSDISQTFKQLNLYPRVFLMLQLI